MELSEFGKLQIRVLRNKSVDNCCETCKKHLYIVNTEKLIDIREVESFCIAHLVKIENSKQSTCDYYDIKTPDFRYNKI